MTALAKRIETTGWSTVLLGVVCIALAAIQAVTPILLKHLATVLDPQDDPTRGMREAWSAGAETGAWVNGIFGAALVVVGIAVARRVRWAHAALTISCWASLVVLAAMAKPTLAPFFAMAGDGKGSGGGMLAAGALLLVAQIGAVLWFLRFWRRPEVRAAFRVLAMALLFGGRAAAAEPLLSSNMFAQWSWDGKRIAFTSARDDDAEIYVMHADGSGQRRLTHSPGIDMFPTFSRDGKHIAFTSSRDGDPEVYVMNADGSEPTQLTWLKGFAGVPVYSPDEKQIAFQWRSSSKPEDPSKKWVICVMLSDGSKLRVITDGRFNDQVPNWSRDGQQLLFFSDRTGRNQIYTMKPDGSVVSPLATTASDDLAAFWSPDNERVLFASEHGGSTQIYVMHRDGSNRIRLTGNVESPTGR